MTIVNGGPIYSGAMDLLSGALYACSWSLPVRSPGLLEDG